MMGKMGRREAGLEKGVCGAQQVVNLHEQIPRAPSIPLFDSLFSRLERYFAFDCLF